MASGFFRRLFLTGVLAFAVTVAFSSCVFFEKSSGSDSSVDVPIAYDSANPVTKLDTSAGPLHVTVSNLSGKSVFLVKCNLSPSDAESGTTGLIDESSVESGRSAAPADSALAGRSISLAGGNASAVSGTFGDVTRLDNIHARNFTSSSASHARGARSVTLAESLVTPSAVYVSPSLGDSKSFSVEGPYQADGVTQYWTTVNATLRAGGAHCLVWVEDPLYDNSSSESTDGKIKSAQAAEIAAKFDTIYYPETALLGYEYGGDPSSATYKGVDGEARINILVCDINYDSSASQEDGVVGYFWAKDLLPDEYFGTYVEANPVSSTNVKSNKAEIFYLDALFADKYPLVAYSTLAHEFQHMINFNQKNIRLNNLSLVPTWYNEMLSMVTEDLLSPTLGIGFTAKEHPQYRFAYFNYYYRGTGLTYWPSDNTVSQYSYPFAYAFGAYLARNYGGAKLVEAMMDTDSAGIDSVSGAFTALGLSADFTDAFLKFGEALVYTSPSAPASVNTYNRKPADYSLSTSNGTFTYSFTPFDIWSLPNVNKDSTSQDAYGPSIFLSSDAGISAYGISLESVNALIGVSGTVSFDIAIPADPDVAMYVMIK